MSTLLVLSAVGNLGKKGVIMVVHHTDCGLQTASDEEIRKVLEEGVEEPGKGGLGEGSFWKFREARRERQGRCGNFEIQSIFQGHANCGIRPGHGDGSIERGCRLGMSSFQLQGDQFK